MDRNKMIAGNPTAMWVVIQDPNEGGHMPADMDGFALPPTNAPGVFVSLHGDGMYIYRLKPNFTSPGATTKTLQAIVPIAPANAACGGGTCIPQPGAGSLDALSDRLMFRAAYRNFVDHESLVVSHAVDPSVSGLVSGVRWYDIRLSGTPDATCPTYPCMYQQGTIADVPNGRNRWMSSLQHVRQNRWKREPQLALHRPGQGGPARHDDGPRGHDCHRHRQQHRPLAVGRLLQHEQRPCRRLHVLVRQPVLRRYERLVDAHRVGRVPRRKRPRPVPRHDLRHPSGVAAVGTQRDDARQ
jgi:hypothetical protein